MSFLETVLSIVEHLPKPIGREASRLGVNYFAASTPARPRAFSLWSAEPKPPGDASGPITDYTSWPSLVDRRWNGRHLPPADPAYVSALPKDEPPNAASQTVGQITELFARRGRMKTCRATSTARRRSRPRASRSSRGDAIVSGPRRSQPLGREPRDGLAWLGAACIGVSGVYPRESTRYTSRRAYILGVS